MDSEEMRKLTETLYDEPRNDQNWVEIVNWFVFEKMWCLWPLSRSLFFQVGTFIFNFEIFNWKTKFYILSYQCHNFAVRDNIEYIQTTTNVREIFSWKEISYRYLEKCNFILPKLLKIKILKEVVKIHYQNLRIPFRLKNILHPRISSNLICKLR